MKIGVICYEKFNSDSSWEAIANEAPKNSRKAVNLDECFVGDDFVGGDIKLPVHLRYRSTIFGYYIIEIRDSDQLAQDLRSSNNNTVYTQQGFKDCSRVGFMHFTDNGVDHRYTVGYFELDKPVNLTKERPLLAKPSC